MTGQRLNGWRRLSALLVLVCLPCAVTVNGQKKPKHKPTEAAELKHTMQESLPVEPTRATACSANGSLFSDDATAGSLFSDFKPRRVGDLVFVDVVETSTATVSSTAKRSRDSGTLGGLVGATGALPVPGAAIVG